MRASKRAESYIDSSLRYQPGSDLQTDKVYAGYIAWCIATGYPPLSQHAFEDIARDTGFRAEYRRNHSDPEGDPEGLWKDMAFRSE